MYIVQKSAVFLIFYLDLQNILMEIHFFFNAVFDQNMIKHVLRKYSLLTLDKLQE